MPGVVEGTLIVQTDLYDGLVEENGGLKVSIRRSRAEIGGNKHDFPGAVAQVVTNNSTNYVYLDSACVLQVSQTGWPVSVDHLRLARVVTASGLITKIIDERVLLAAGSGANISAALHFDAFDLVAPASADFPVTKIAGYAADDNHNGLKVCRYDDEVEEGRVMREVLIPGWASTMKFIIRSRAHIAPPADAVAALSLYPRDLTGPVAAWAAAILLTDVQFSMANGEAWVKGEHIDTLANMGLAAGGVYQMLLARNATAVADTLVDDWVLRSVDVDFS